MTASQYCVGFCHTTMYTYISSTSIHMSPPSWTFSPPPPHPTGRLSQSISWTTCADRGLALAIYATYGNVYRSMLLSSLVHLLLPLLCPKSVLYVHVFEFPSQGGRTIRNMDLKKKKKKERKKRVERWVWMRSCVKSSLWNLLKYMLARYPGRTAYKAGWNVKLDC